MQHNVIQKLLPILDSADGKLQVTEITGSSNLKEYTMPILTKQYSLVILLDNDKSYIIVGFFENPNSSTAFHT